MKKILFSMLAIFAAGTLRATCPVGYVEIESADFKELRGTEDCPVGFVEITNSTYLPFYGMCDTSVGICSTETTCQAP